MNKLNLINILLFILVFASCEKKSSKCFTSKGKIIEENRILTEFNTILVNDIFNVILVQDTVYKVILEGGENLLPAVTTDVINDTLLIDNTIKCNWLRDYDKINLFVHFENLEYLVTSAPVKVMSYDTVKCNSLEYYAIGEIGEADLILNCSYFRFDDSFNTLGHFKFRGKTDYSRFFINYGSSLYAKNLISEKTDILYHTIGDMYIHVSGHLRAWIWGSGTVYYTGNPGLVEVIEKSSTGHLVKTD